MDPSQALALCILWPYWPKLEILNRLRDMCSALLLLAITTAVPAQGQDLTRPQKREVFSLISGALHEHFYDEKLNGVDWPSVEERYASKDDYLNRVEGVARDLVSEGYLLDEDVPRVGQMAGERYDLLESQVKQTQPAGD